MHPLLTAFIPGLAALASVFALIAGVTLWQKRVKKRNRRSPLTQKMLRPPGESLRIQIVDLDFENNFMVVMLIVMPFIMFAIHVSQSYFGEYPESLIRVGGSVVIALVAGFIMLRKITTALDKRRRLVLGLEGELATGEELNQLMLSGCRVYHDVPTDYGNIDHVVVSNSGVFSVETKMVGKLNDGGTCKITVDHNSDTVKFGDLNWKIPTQQLDTNSNWLSKHLTKAVGRPIEVESMLALPGYFIEQRIGRSNVFVFNPKDPKRFFVHKRKTHTPEQVQQIAHQIEQLCRNVEPSFGYKKEWD